MLQPATDWVFFMKEIKDKIMQVFALKEFLVLLILTDIMWSFRQMTYYQEVTC